MASRGRGHRGRPRGTSQAPSAFDQQAFVEAVGIAVVAIAQACAIVNQGRSNDLQRLEAHHPPTIRGGVDCRVRTTMTTEGEEASRIWVLVLRGREINLLLVQERSRRLLAHKGSRAPVIRAREELGLPDGQDRCYVSTANSPDI